MFRRPAGAFPAGTSGNPGGRPRGLRALAAALDDARDAAKVIPVLEKLRELALSGDVGAARAYLDRMVGPVRSGVEEAEDLTERTFEELAQMAAAAPEIWEPVLTAVLREPVQRERLRERLAREEQSP